MPQIEDLVNLIKAIENVNGQLLIENKFLRDQCEQHKTSVFRLIEENGALSKELKSITVHDILAEFEKEAHNERRYQMDTRNNKEYYYTIDYFLYLMDFEFNVVFFKAMNCIKISCS